MLVKFEQNRMVQTTRNVELFDKKKKKKKHFLKPFLTELTAFGRRTCSLNYCLMLNYECKVDYHVSVFQKLHSDTCNQVKSCTKHDRPDQSQRKLTVKATVSFS